jgi:hypothetical protein
MDVNGGEFEEEKAQPIAKPVSPIIEEIISVGSTKVLNTLPTK